MKELNVEAQVAILQGNSTEREKNTASQLLVQRFNRSLLFFVSKMVRQVEEAEDIVQQVWEKAFSRIDQYQPTGAFSTWVFKIANNQVIDVKRKRKLDVVSLKDPLSNEVTDDNLRSHKLMMSLKDVEPNPEEAININARKDMVRDLIDMLSPQMKTIIELRYFEELSYDEIAETIGKPVGTVKIQLHRAKNKMEKFAVELNLQERF